MGAAGNGSGTANVWQSEIYEPGTEMLTKTGDVPSGSCQHVATLLVDGPLGGRVLVTGNDGGAFLFDPTNLSFARTGSMKIAREAYAQTALPGGRVLVAGGSRRLADGGLAGLAEAEVYDPFTQAFVSTDSMKRASGANTGVPIDGEHLLVVGGSVAEIYDVAAGKFTSTVPMTTERVCPVATYLGAGRVLVAGGYEPYRVGGPSVLQPLSSAEVYDSATGRFTPTGAASAPAPWAIVEPSGWASGSPTELLNLDDGRVLAIVSIYGLDVFSDSGYLIEIYDPTAGTLAPVVALPPTYEPDVSLACATRSTAVTLPDGRVFFPGRPSVVYWP